MLATRICCNVFGVLGLILNRILSVSYKGTSLGYPGREDMYLTLVQSIWRFVTDSRYRYSRYHSYDVACFKEGCRYFGTSNF